MLSLPDWAFYPIATATAAGMIAAAMSFGNVAHRTPEEIRAEGLIYEGERLAAMTLGNGLTVEFLTEDGSQFARIAAARGPLDGLQSAGAFFTLSPDEIEAFQGHRLRVTYTLRATPEQGAEQTLLNVFMPERGQATWVSQATRENYESLTIELSPARCELGFAYVSLWPDWRAQRNQVDLQRVELTALEPLPCES